MRIFAITLLALSALAFADQKPKPQQPAVLSAKTVAFVTFDSSDKGQQLKKKASDFFSKWKRYKVVDNPHDGDLIVLLGPMPAKINSDALEAVLDGKQPSDPVNLAGARDEFAVFNGADMHASSEVSLHSLWSSEMQGDDVNTAAKKFKEVVNKTAEKAGNAGLTNNDCYMLGLKTCR